MTAEPPLGAIADTGALYALLDQDDRWHAACVAAFPRLRLPLLTTMAVLTELLHLVGDDAKRVAAAWKLIRSGAVTVKPMDDADLATLEQLMAKYADRPMDLADATLVLLARRERITTVFTIDHDDFETYRLDGRKRFRILPERR